MDGKEEHDDQTGLVLNEVSYRHGLVPVLSRQSIVVPPGDSLVLTGANGVGKSTFLYLCAGLLAPQHGSVNMAGRRIDGEEPSALVRWGIRRGVVFQQGGLVANLSALANVGLSLRYHADLLGLSHELIDARARSCLGAVGVFSPDIHSLPGRLSFGVRKRVAFARAMAQEPNFVFFDDPNAGLDRENAGIVEEILVSYREDSKVTMVVATNDRALIERLDAPVVELNNGCLKPWTPGTKAPPSSR